MKLSERLSLITKFFGVQRRAKFPYRVNMKRYFQGGCTFEVSSPVETFRIEKYGDEEDFTGLILDEIKKGDVFFDIGACVGLVSAHAAKLGAIVYSFEPDPYYRSRLINNIGLNNLDNVNVLEWAVSDNEDVLELFTDGEGGNSPSLRKIGDRGSVNVKTNSIDNAINRGEVPCPDIVKLDIEGAEILALRGMRSVLVSAEGPRAIFMEVHPDFLKHFSSSAQEVEEVMLGYGYHLDYKIERSDQQHCVFKKDDAKKSVK